MPLARISVPAGKSADYRKTVGDVVYESMLPTLKAPEGDRFQIVTEHSPNDLILDPNYLGISRTKEAIIVQLTLREGRTVEQKKDFFKMVADGLHDRLKVRREDVFINLVETKKEDWSFGNGVAQYVQ
jgi:phenylpyruvate tautomerase PptA (4-oxalocrotonate tautomerase family)